ncbi:glycosyl hydrolase [Pararhodobacter sp. SW119]|uniref:glycoside hydrolase family 26 protein n=1 Tax=Pararhodobacter sp. SW119 TaxID=2780075 RepID=UPI001AE0C921|nr:glycosyl hydrolase [Pararhodobacter sp. SW119]
MTKNRSAATRAAAPACATLIAALATSAAAQVAPLPPGDIPFGVYDPPGNFARTDGVTIEHLFLPWEDVALASLVDAADYATARGRVLLVTLEPWTWVRNERSTPAALREGIFSGAYDPNVLSICAVLGQLPVPVTFRWGHEMEDDRGQFIWAGWSPAAYIAAFRRVIDLCRSVAPGISIMWSPLGEEGMQDYWPGADYVDLVGLSVFGYQPADRAWFGRDRTFSEILEPRYARAVPFGRPIVVAELGYSGTTDYVAAWEAEVRAVGDRFPDLVGVVLFNYPEVYPWPDGLGQPDWRVFFRVTD